MLIHTLEKLIVAVDWSSVLCFVVYVCSASALPVVSRLLLTRLHFPFPSVLAAIHAVTLSLCLSFWTLLSIFKPRLIPLSRLLPLSLAHSLVSLAHMHNLFRNSLLHYQLARFLSLLALSPSYQKHCPNNIRRGMSVRLTLVCVVILLVTLHPPRSLLAFIAAVVMPLFDLKSYPHQLRTKTRATDLQLQLFTRALSAAFLCFMAPTLDTRNNTRLLHALASVLADLDRPIAFFVYSSAMLAFFTFVSLRVAHAKLDPYAFRSASILASFPPLMLHFTVDGQQEDALTNRQLFAATTTNNSVAIFEAMVRRCVDVVLIFLLLACVHHITLSNIPGFNDDGDERLQHQQLRNDSEYDDDDYDEEEDDEDDEDEGEHDDDDDSDGDSDLHYQYLDHQHAQDHLVDSSSDSQRTACFDSSHEIEDSDNRQIALERSRKIHENDRFSPLTTSSAPTERELAFTPTSITNFQITTF